MKNKIFCLSFIFLLIYSPPVYSNDGIGAFIVNTFKSLFRSFPVKQMYKLEKAILKKKGNEKQYLGALRKIVTDLDKYKEGNPQKFETTVNLTLALARYEIYLLTLDRGVCINSYHRLYKQCKKNPRIFAL